ncbi:lipid kinase YegS [Vibrio crassostreae]|uniref:lipid kinase YegS n=1 Tax=Vibrio crassostreae TaxID=246167 RepID=UPI0006351045|nr:lipid kinase YegS [Vibrio crassostreae]ROP20583.1 lipid kinase YegS [Vibrio crassostreae]ROP22028.1 lipid kinase YegS [Vibrio crassostreae]RPE95567.1 lipid kinase YegS [Vibrio crassostreae]TCN68739.1 lipid kinase YegS [Vibrio crassostreae]TCN99808.1 lipid kinase YegS [Vibrio crassostreae]
MDSIRAILNGKKANIPELRQAVFAARDRDIDLQVRVTWESSDMFRLVSEAICDGVKRLIVAGGDGTVNEAVNALNQFRASERPQLAIIPMGTANDFATATGIPSDIAQAFTLALEGKAFAVDSVRANDRYFMNVAAAGFGAEVTAETPVELKDFLGGGAYTLTGVVKALGFKPYSGTLTIDKGTFTGEILVGAFCNGRLAGGGQELAPNALIDDGLMDLTLVKAFVASDLPKVIEELKHPADDGKHIVHTQARWLEIDFPQSLPINLDGEPYRSNQIRFEVMPSSISLVLPDDSPCLVKNQ